MLKVKKAYESRFLNMYEHEFGENKHYVFASRKKEEDLFSLRPDAVSCIIILKFPNGVKKLLLSYEYRYPIDKYILSPTAGCMDEKDKSVIETAIREIHEELGLDVGKNDIIEVINPMVFSSPGMTDESNALVVCTINVSEDFAISRKFAEETEKFKGFELLTKRDAFELLENGVDKNGVPYPVYTWCALMHFVYS